MKRSDQIFIRGLKVCCHVGVPDEERAVAQELRINVTLSPYECEGALNDDINATIDYYAVSLRVDEVARAKPRKLIETLAEDFAEMILGEFAVAAVMIEIEKFIMPNTRCVGVKITREAL